MNRVGLGLAVGAGYVLGRTKKMKLAFAVGSLVAGKRMQLGPRALADLVSQQLRNNPQFKEIGDQLREDLRGVGQAASGAMVERQMDALADRLHGRTAEVREQLTDVTDRAPDLGPDDEETEGYEEEEREPEAEEEDGPEAEEKAPAKKAPAKKAPARKTAARKTAAKKTAAKKTSPAKTTARKTAARKTTPGKRAAKKTAEAGRTARGAEACLPKDGDE
jgi:hypothetical protein